MPMTEQPDCENKTEARKLAEGYSGLGGRWKSKILPVMRCRGNGQWAYSNL